MTDLDTGGVGAVVASPMSVVRTRRSFFVMSSLGCLGLWAGLGSVGRGFTPLESRVLPGLIAVVVDWERCGLWVPLACGDYRWFSASRRDRRAIGGLARHVLGRDVDLWAPEWKGRPVDALPMARDLLQSRFSGLAH